MSTPPTPRQPNFYFVAIDPGINPQDISRFTDGKTEEEIYDSLLINEEFRNIIFYPTSINVEKMRETIMQKILIGDFIDGDILYIGGHDIEYDLPNGFSVVIDKDLEDTFKFSTYIFNFREEDDENDELDGEKDDTDKTIWSTMFNLGFMYAQNVEDELRRFHTVFLKSPGNTSTMGPHILEYDFNTLSIKDMRTVWYTFMKFRLKSVISFDNRLSSKYMTYTYPNRYKLPYKLN
jgi:hypothetical protein